jgi:hypothetical protein
MFIVQLILLCTVCSIYGYGLGIITGKLYNLLKSYNTLFLLNWVACFLFAVVGLCLMLIYVWCY